MCKPDCTFPTIDFDVLMNWQISIQNYTDFCVHITYIYIKNKPQQKDIHHGFIDILIVSDTTQFSVTFVSSWWNEFIPNHSIINDKNKTIGIVVGIYRCSVWMRQNTLKMKQVLLFRASFNKIPTGSYNQYPITAPIHSSNYLLCFVRTFIVSSEWFNCVKLF